MNIMSSRAATKDEYANPMLPDEGLPASNISMRRWLCRFSHLTVMPPADGDLSPLRLGMQQQYGYRRRARRDIDWFRRRWLTSYLWHDADLS